MSLASWHALCIDSTDAGRMASFWAPTLGMSSKALDNGAYHLTSDVEHAEIWVGPVPEPKTVKNRVHLDVDVGSLDGLYQLGATELRPPTEEDHWSIMADVEGGEFCAFLRDGRPSLPGRLYEVVVDCVDARSQANWWGDVLGLPPEGEPKEHFAALESAGKLPFDYWCFVDVPEPKIGKNRVHWDIDCKDVDALVSRGARLLREPDDDIYWHVMADPEGNEFCVFTD